MLQYRRRNSNTPLLPRVTQPTHLLLTYCNWSYRRDRHINMQILRSILTHFQENYIRFYLRIINETPSGLAYSFMEQESLNPNTLTEIHQILSERGFDLREMKEL